MPKQSEQMQSQSNLLIQMNTITTTIPSVISISPEMTTKR